MALLVATITVSSACVAAPSDWIHFTLEPSRQSGEIRASFREERGEHDSNWSTGFRPSELIGLDVAGFSASGSRPLQFALVRESGRLDCAGHGGDSYAGGSCRFTADAAFNQFLESRGIGRPNERDGLSLMAVDVHRTLVEALASARYPTPTIEQLIELAAVGVDQAYIRGLAGAGYRPASLNSLVEFRALDITPDYIGGLSRVGYAGLAANDLVQFKALDITPEFISGFQRIGYSHLSADKLVELKALDVTPEFVRAAERQRGVMPDVAQLAQLKELSETR
jgi:hypothetical protein